MLLVFWFAAVHTKAMTKKREDDLKTCARIWRNRALRAEGLGDADEAQRCRQCAQRFEAQLPKEAKRG